MSAISALGVGSGLDLSGLLDQLNQAERQKLIPITQQKSIVSNKISAYGKLESAMSGLQDAVSVLNGEATFQAMKNTTVGGSVQAAVTSDAVPGKYTVEVGSLASAYSVATAGIADQTSELGDGQISMTLQNGQVIELDIVSDESSLEDIRDAINASGEGVRAAIVNDGSAAPYRLALESTGTGSQAAIASVDFGSLSTSLSLDMSTEVLAQDADLTINGIQITSQKNQLDDAVQGLTLKLEETGTATITVERHTGAIRGAVEDFVDAYNNLKQLTGQLTYFDVEGGAAGELLGDSTLRRIELRLRSVLTGGGSESAPYGNLSELGISLQLNGELELDSERLTQLIEQEPEAVQAFFAGNADLDGLAGKLGDTLDGILNTDGLLDSASTGLEGRLGRLDERYQRMERSIAATVSRYRSQFAQLDSLVASMNSTSAYLTQQFDIMNAQLGNIKK